MFQITCSNCGTRLNAKESLIGQTHPCPKCKHPLLIVKPEQPEPTGSDDDTGVISAETPPTPPPLPETDTGEIAVAHLDKPKKLNPAHRYLVVGKDRLIARWDGVGAGWQVNVGGKFDSAKRNSESLPSRGHFVLIELTTREVDGGHRLGGIRIFSLPDRWALGALARDQESILDKITGHSGLAREQKQMVRAYIREKFMPEFTEGADALFEFLGNADSHTHTVAPAGE